MHQKARLWPGSGQGTCGFGLPLGHVREATIDVSLSHQCFSLSLSLHPLKIKNKPKKHHTTLNWPLTHQSSWATDTSCLCLLKLQELLASFEKGVSALIHSGRKKESQMLYSLK